MAVGWPNEKEYWFSKGKPGEIPKGMKAIVQPDIYSQAPSLPLYVMIELEHPFDGAYLSNNHPTIRWSVHEFLKTYELRLVRRDVSANLLKGLIIGRNSRKDLIFKLPIRNIDRGNDMYAA